MAKLGDTFRLTNLGIDSHLHIIISDPTQDSSRIVTVNFTSWRADKDQSCIVEVREHRFIKFKSCVHYRQDRLITLAQYEHSLATGDLSAHEPVNQDLLRRILDGAAVSPFLPLGNRQILVEQGLIDRE